MHRRIVFNYYLLMIHSIKIFIKYIPIFKNRWSHDHLDSNHILYVSPRFHYCYNRDINAIFLLDDKPSCNNYFI